MFPYVICSPDLSCYVSFYCCCVYLRLRNARAFPFVVRAGVLHRLIIMVVIVVHRVVLFSCLIINSMCVRFIRGCCVLLIVLCLSLVFVFIMIVMLLGMFIRIKSVIIRLL